MRERKGAAETRFLAKACKQRERVMKVKALPGRGLRSEGGSRMPPARSPDHDYSASICTGDEPDLIDLRKSVATGTRKVCDLCLDSLKSGETLMEGQNAL